LSTITDEGHAAYAGRRVVWACAAGAFCAAAPVGRLLDRHGARRMVLPSLTLLGVAVASLSLLTPSLIHLYAASAVIGLATVGASPVAYSRAILSWFDRRRGRALGLMLAGPAIAAIVMPPIVASLIEARRLACRLVRRRTSDSRLRRAGRLDLAARSHDRDFAP
jgi:MFS family permease